MHMNVQLYALMSRIFCVYPCLSDRERRENFFIFSVSYICSSLIIVAFSRSSLWVSYVRTDDDNLEPKM